VGMISAVFIAFIYGSALDGLSKKI